MNCALPKEILMAAVKEVTELLSELLSKVLFSPVCLYLPIFASWPRAQYGFSWVARKVLSNLAGAPGPQPGCYRLPESPSICLNAWMHWRAPARCRVSACGWNCSLLMDACMRARVCMLHPRACLCVYAARSWLIERFGCHCTWQEVFSYFPPGC